MSSRSSGLGLHHLALGATDVSQVAHFYGELFALPEVKRHHYKDGRLRSIWLKLDRAVLMIEEVEEPRQPPHSLAQGLFLFCFHTSKLDVFERVLQQRGVVVESRTRHTLYFRDPEENRVAVSDFEFNAASSD